MPPTKQTVDEYWIGYLERERIAAGGFRTNLGRYGKDGSRKLFRNVPPDLKPRAHAELARLLEKAWREGKPITRQKYGSLVANAAFIAIHVVPGAKHRSPHQLKVSRFYNCRSARRRAMNPRPKPGSLIQGPRIVTNPVD